MQARHAILALPPHHHSPIIILRGCTPIILGSTTLTSARIHGAGAPGIVVGDIRVGLTMDGGIAAGGGDDTISLSVSNIQARNVRDGGVNDGDAAITVVAAHPCSNVLPAHRLVTDRVIKMHCALDATSRVAKRGSAR